jgi:hypothetical protein
MFLALCYLITFGIVIKWIILNDVAVQTLGIKLESEASAWPQVATWSYI